MATTLHLRFATRDEAFAALAPFGLVVADPGGGDPLLATTAWPEGIRVDLALVGGDGIDRRQTGTTTFDDPDLGPIEVPVMEATPGFHVNLLWSDDAPPDFGAVAIDPATPSQVFAA